MTYEQALDSLPDNATWSCSFGYPGEGGCNIYYRTPDGTRYVVSNGPWYAFRPFTWTVRKL